MELELEGDTSMVTSGSIEIELPSYMQKLPPEELTEVQSAENRHLLALAAGRHPQTADVHFVTGDGSIYELPLTTQQQHSVPLGVAVTPIDYGHTLAFATPKGYEVDIEWAIKFATVLARPDHT